MKEWISVNDKLPEKENMYIVSDERTATVMIGWYSQQRGFTFMERPMKNITHWMPLPQPPLDNN